MVKSRIGVSRLSVQFGRFGGARWSARWAPASTTTTNEVQVPVSWQTPTPVQGVVAARRPVDNAQGTGTGAEL